jgi:oxalate decarboxylase/phosphoglucose isomerase-like protein (cupin superfamily)
MGQLSPSIITFPTFENNDSFLSIGEYNQHIPFAIERIYWSYGNVRTTERGDHFHPNSERVIICMMENIEITLENLKGETTHYKLTNPNQGLIIPKNHWISMKLEAKAIMLAIASSKFSENESIKDRSQFEDLKNG